MGIAQYPEVVQTREFVVGLWVGGSGRDLCFYSKSLAGWTMIVNRRCRMKTSP